MKKILILSLPFLTVILFSCQDNDIASKSNLKYQNNLSTIRHSIFTAVSIITTTGFSTENFNNWPEMSKTLLFFLSFNTKQFLSLL